MGVSQLRVLIVDDDEDSARMLRVLLKRAGFETQITFDGQSALTLADEFLPQVILLDQTLAGMSGVEVARSLRARSGFDRCVLVAISGHGSETLPSPSPFDRHFQKPVDHEALLEYLTSVPGSRETARSNRTDPPE